MAWYNKARMFTRSPLNILDHLIPYITNCRVHAQRVDTAHDKFEVFHHHTTTIPRLIVKATCIPNGFVMR